MNHQFLQYKLQLLKNLRGKTTVTFLLIFAVKGISAFELFAALRLIVVGAGVGVGEVWNDLVV